MKKFTRVFITGTTKGLGQEITKALLNRVDNIVLVARNEEALKLFRDELKTKHKFKGEIEILTVDLSRMDAIEKIKTYDKPVDLVINNAGVGFMNKFEVNTEAEINHTIMVNNFNLTMICHHFAPLMLKEKRGQIINIGSIAGIIPTPLFSVYGASKAFVVSLSQALDTEYSDRGVRVKVFCPGGIKTEFHRTAGMTDKIIEVNGKYMETPPRTAQDVMSLIDSESALLVPRYYNKMIKLFSHILPTKMVAKETLKMYTQFLKANEKV